MSTPTALLLQNIERAILGKREAVAQTIAALLAGGHILIEDVPGVGKTVLAKALARSLNAGFKRIQFTPDLLPTDITGVSVFSQKTGEFEFHQGPVFTDVLLADELNRATPRTQSALLESMEERQVTADGATYPLPEMFFVIATQNPIEQEGVYRLPEAQLDRFLMKISLGYPTTEQERSIVEGQREGHPVDSLEPVLSGPDVLRMRFETVRIRLAAPLIDYIARLTAATRAHSDVLLGASPRGTLALCRCCQAMALILGRKYVTPDLIKALAAPVFRHRLILKPQARISGRTADQIVSDILDAAEVPVCDYES